MHPDGYVEIRDRAKDIVISGGENLSTVEVEMAILSHETVLEATVIGVPEEKWGERPKAFVVLRLGRSVEAEELRACPCASATRWSGLGDAFGHQLATADLSRIRVTR